jgi:uncharacterized protein YjiS (DUF1127 family)
MLDSISNLLHRVTAGLARRRELRRAYAELSALDDRALADIGISRSEIGYVLTHNPRLPAATARTAPVGAALRRAA